MRVDVAQGMHCLQAQALIMIDLGNCLQDLNPLISLRTIGSIELVGALALKLESEGEVPVTT